MSNSITYTEAEQKVIAAIRSLKDDGIDMIYAGDIEYAGVGDLKQLRGTLSSLVKKGAIHIDRKYDNLISLFI